MSVQIIKRIDGEKSRKETIERIKTDAPQISYSSEGRIAIRIPQDNGDTLVVLNKPLSRELIGFIKNRILDNLPRSSYCKNCSSEEIPF